MTILKLKSTKVVEEFWRLMATNDFYSVMEVLSPNFVLEWPQSNELIRGGEKFAQMNTEYPSNGLWLFNINRMVCAESDVVTDVSVTDGVQRARAISFFTLRDEKITRMVEYWPEPYAAPHDRSHITELLF